MDRTARDTDNQPPQTGGMAGATTSRAAAPQHVKQDVKNAGAATTRPPMVLVIWHDAKTELAAISSAMLARWPSVRYMIVLQPVDNNSSHEPDPSGSVRPHLIAVRTETIGGGADGRRLTADVTRKVATIGPLRDRMVVHSRIVAALTRQTAVTATRKLDSEFFRVPPFIRRRECIDRIMRRHCADLPPDEYVQRLFPLSNLAAERRNADIIARR